MQLLEFGLPSLTRLSQVIQGLDLYFGSLCLIPKGVPRLSGLTICHPDDEDIVGKLQEKKRLYIIYSRFKIIDKAKVEEYLPRVALREKVGKDLIHQTRLLLLVSRAEGSCQPTTQPTSCC